MIPEKGSTRCACGTLSDLGGPGAHHDTWCPLYGLENDAGLCLVGGDDFGSSWASMSGRKCSLPRGHEGQHIAYVGHRVTGNGADVYWLGPWSDGRPYEGELTDRLQEEWFNRDLTGGVA